jgi:hypothetical protein
MIENINNYSKGLPGRCCKVGKLIEIFGKFMRWSYRFGDVAGDFWAL